MRTGQFGNEHVLVLEPGEHAIETLTNYLTEHRVTGGHFVAIGGFRELELKYFNVQKKEYAQRRVREQVEVVSLVGNVALRDGKPYIHAHLVVGTPDYRSLDGHLGEGIVEPTLEVFLTQIDGTLVREKDPRTGLDALHPEVGVRPSPLAR